MTRQNIQIVNCPEYRPHMPAVPNVGGVNKSSILGAKEIQKLLVFVDAFRGDIDGNIGPQTLQ